MESSGVLELELGNVVMGNEMGIGTDSDIFAFSGLGFFHTMAITILF
jgi:hypothetical protein